jgi:hypothetical protein
MPDDGAATASGTTADDGPAPPKHRHRFTGEKLMRRSLRGDSYGTLLFMIVVLLGTIPLDTFAWGKVVTAVAAAAMLIVAYHTSQVSAGLLRLAWGASAVVVAISVVEAFADLPRLSALASFSMALLVLLAPFVVMRRIFGHEKVAIETLVGAICVYVLFGLAFTYVYGFMNKVQDGGFFVELTDPVGVDFIFFSYTTLTTTGYGDLTPSGSVGRVLAVFEMLVGVLYLATTISRLVAVFKPSGIRHGGDGNGGDGD